MTQSTQSLCQNGQTLQGFWLVSGWWNPIHYDLLEKTCTVRTRNPCSRGSRFGNLADYPSSDKPAATRRDDAATLHLPTYEILWANIMVILWGLYRTNFHVLKHVLDKHSASACWMAMTTTHGWSKWVLPLYGRHVLPSKMMWWVVCRQLIGMKIGFSSYSDVIYWILLNYIHVCLPYSVIFWFPYISLICRSQVSLIHTTLSTHCGPQRDDFKEKNYGSLGISRIPTISQPRMLMPCTLFLASWIWLKIIQNL